MSPGHINIHIISWCPHEFSWFPFSPLHTLQPTLVVPLEVQQWQKRKAEFDRHWGPLSAAIKGSAINPLPVDYSLGLQEMLQSASSQMEGRAGEHRHGLITASYLNFIFNQL